MIPFGPFEPSRARYAASTSIINCLPKADGWGPWPGLAILSEALAAMPLGMVLVRTFSGAYDIYAGTTTKLYKLDTTSTPYAWTDVSRLSGGDYSVTTGYRWSFHQFGTYLYAANGTDVLQRIHVGSGTNFDASPGSPPIAQFVSSAGDFLVLGRISGAPNRVQWSTFNNAELWTVGTRGASYQDLNTGNEVMAVLSAETGAIVVQRNAIQSMSLVLDATAAFRFDVLNPSRGTIAPYSVVNIGAGQFAYLSEQGFHMNVEGQAIGDERVDDWFLNRTADRDKMAEIVGWLDPFNKVVLWRFQKIDGDMAILGYNYRLDRWCYSDTAVVDIAALATPGLTIDGLDDLFDTIDDIDIPHNSRIFTGGRPTLAGFNENFELGWFSGDNLAATLETAQVQLTPPDRAFLSEARVVTDAPPGSLFSPGFTLKVGTANIIGAEPTWGSAVTPFASTGICHFRSPALMHKFRLEIDAGTAWSTATAVDSRAVPEGRR